MPTERCTECGRTRAAHESYELHQRTRGLAYHNWNSHGYWTDEQRRGLEVHYEHSGDEHMGDKDWPQRGNPPSQMTGDGELFPQRWAFGVTDREVIVIISAVALLGGVLASENDDQEPDECMELLKRLLTHRDQRQAADVRLQEELEK